LHAEQTWSLAVVHVMLPVQSVIGEQLWQIVAEPLLSLYSPDWQLEHCESVGPVQVMVPLHPVTSVHWLQLSADTPTTPILR
jgi:hypothetical protein